MGHHRQQMRRRHFGNRKDDISTAFFARNQHRCRYLLIEKRVHIVRIFDRLLVTRRRICKRVVHSLMMCRIRGELVGRRQRRGREKIVKRVVGFRRWRHERVY